MATEFWEKWEYKLWLSSSDVTACSPATRAIWFDALNHMMERLTYKLTGTPEQLAQFCRCTVTALVEAVEQLARENVAEVHKQNGTITLVSRKRQKEFELRELRRKAASKGGSKTSSKVEAASNSNSFIHFFSSYPRRVGRADAANAWLRVEGDKHIELILTALEWQKKLHDWTKDGGKYIPYPATYLRQMRWLDERPTETSSSKPLTFCP